MIVAYLAHPVGGDPVRNANRARRWLRYLIDGCPRIAWAVPWLPYVDVLDDADERHRAVGMLAALAFLPGCELLVLVGGYVSPGMVAEIELAREYGIPVVNLAAFGAEPPPLGDERSTALLSILAEVTP